MLTRSVPWGCVFWTSGLGIWHCEHSFTLFLFKHMNLLVETFLYQLLHFLSWFCYFFFLFPNFPFFCHLCYLHCPLLFWPFLLLIFFLLFLFFLFMLLSFSPLASTILTSFTLVSTTFYTFLDISSFTPPLFSSQSHGYSMQVLVFLKLHSTSVSQSHLSSSSPYIPDNRYLLPLYIQLSLSY